MIPTSLKRQNGGLTRRQERPQVVFQDQKNLVLDEQDVYQFSENHEH